jgi:hypothetical protein
MFVKLALPLLSAIRRDPFAVSSRLSGAFPGPEFTSPASGLSFENESAKRRERCQVSQNDDPPRIVILSSGESHQQDELSPVNTVEPERRISLMPPTVNISSRINTYAEVTHNSLEMNTYAIRQIRSRSE